MGTYYKEFLATANTKKIIKDYKNIQHMKKVAELHNVSAKHVKRLLDDNNIELNHQNKAGSKRSTEQKQAISNAIKDYHTNNDNKKFFFICDNCGETDLSFTHNRKICDECKLNGYKKPKKYKINLIKKNENTKELNKKNKSNNNIFKKYEICSNDNCCNYYYHNYSNYCDPCRIILFGNNSISKNNSLDLTKYGYIYRITNNLNGHTYIGQHRIRADEAWLSYMGSGRKIINSIDKYGKNNFSKELLCYAESLEELLKVELEYIATETILGHAEYNISGRSDGLIAKLSDLNITDDELISWYFDDKLSFRAIERKLDLSSGVVSRYLVKKYKGIDPRFDEISERYKRTTNLITNTKKIDCIYCGRSTSPNNIKRHENICLLNPDAIIRKKPKYKKAPKNNKTYGPCNHDGCDKQLKKKSSKYCKDHWRLYTDYSTYNRPTTYSPTLTVEAREKLAREAKYKTHIKHHVDRVIFVDLCGHCVSYCEGTNIPFTITKNIIMELLNNNKNRNQISEHLNINRSTLRKYMREYSII